MTAARLGWTGGLALFVVAAATGSVFRIGMLAGLPDWLSFENLRHAHSHLMYFGWATPVLMGLIAARLEEHGVDGDARRRFRFLVAAALVAASLAYVPFLVSGYGPTTLAGHAVPLSISAAGLNALVWYGFALCYWHATRGLHRTRVLRLWDAALTFLLLASLGPLGRGMLPRMGLSALFWEHATIHWFLGLFADGWFVLAVLGLAWHARGGVAAAGRWGQRLVVIGLPGAALLAVPMEGYPVVQVVAPVSGLVAATGFVLLTRGLWPGGDTSGALLWRLVLVLLSLRALTLVLQGLAPGVGPGVEGLRVLYLHVVLVGVVSVGLWTAAADLWPVGWLQRLGRWWAVAACVLLASLVPMTGWWPGAWSGPWTLWLAAAATLGLPLVAVTALPRVGALVDVGFQTPVGAGDPNRTKVPTARDEGP